MHRCPPLIAPTKTRATGTHNQEAEESYTNRQRCAKSRDMDGQQQHSVGLPGQMAESLTLIQRIWDAHKMRPYPRGWLTLSTDPGAAAKLGAILDLHLNPLPNSVVLHLDEKPISGTLVGDGRCAPRNDRRLRQRVGDLFAALNPVSGKIIARLMRSQQHEEFIHFLNVLNRETPARHRVHLVLDNFAPHKHATTQEWLSRHSRFKLHFSPAGMSWTNLVELLFSDLTRRRLKWSTYASAAELRAAVADFIASASVERRFRIFGHP